MTALILCLLAAPPTTLERGIAELDAFHSREAVDLLELALTEGPYAYADYVRLYEHLGIAHAYLDQTEAALTAFDMLLTLAPGHAISYTLSPKITFLFEQARSSATNRPAPTIQVSWPPDAQTSQKLPLTLRVVADPKELMQRAELHVRRRGEETFAKHTLDLPEPGNHELLVLPPSGATTDEVLELYVTAKDTRDNEVFLWASEAQPRQVRLAYVPPEPWYEKWWIWATVGTVVAAGTGVAVWALVRPEPTTTDGSFTVRRN